MSSRPPMELVCSSIEFYYLCKTASQLIYGFHKGSNIRVSSDAITIRDVLSSGIPAPFHRSESDGIHQMGCLIEGDLIHLHNETKSHAHPHECHITCSFVRPSSTSFWRGSVERNLCISPTIFIPEKPAMDRTRSMSCAKQKEE